MRAVVAAACLVGAACKGAHAPETEPVVGEAAVSAASVAEAAAVPVPSDAAVPVPSDAAADPGSEEPVGSAPGEAWSPTAVQAEMIRRFSARDEAAPCPSVEEGSDEPVSDLLAIVAHVEKPAWVGMRAAACVAGGHAVEAQEAMVGWVTGDQTKGLAIAMVGMLDGMPEDVALTVATAAAGGPHAADLAKRAAQVKNDDVRDALAAGLADMPVAQ